MDTATSRRRRDGAIRTQAWTILSAHLDALLTLDAEPMMRDNELVELSGADAGLDILYLTSRCHHFLTDTEQRARHLSGVYCDCGYPELYEVLDANGQQAGARCRQCGDQYNREEYAELTRDPADSAKSYRRSSLRPIGADDLVSRRA
jgi:hypothetical protein